MVAVWLSASFAVWLLAGWAIWRRLPQWRVRLEGQSRSLRAAAGVGLLLVSAVILLGGLALASARAPRFEDLGAGGMAAATAGGLVFVVLQTLTALILISLSVPSVTNTTAKPSKLGSPEGIDP